MTDNTDRLLGRLISTVEALQRDQERLQKELNAAQDRLQLDLASTRERLEVEIRDINKKVSRLYDYVNEAKGGKKALAALLFAATTFGGVVWELAQRVIK